MTMTYSEKLKDPRWQRKRTEILNRDGFKCRDCGADDKTLHVHHCFYERGEPWKTRDGLLLTLCKDCHKTLGEMESDAKLALGMICARMGHAEDDFQLKEFVDELCSAVKFESSTVMYEYVVIDLWERANDLKHHA